MKMKDWLLKYRLFFIVLFFICVPFLSYFLSFSLRFEFNIPPREWLIFTHSLPLLILIRLAFAYRYGFFQGWWRYAGIPDLIDIFKYDTLSSLSFILGLFLFQKIHGFPRSVLVIDWLGNIVFIGGIRFLVRILRESLIYLKQSDRKNKKCVLIVGAGDTGVMILREMKNNPRLNYLPIGFVDDDERKMGAKIHGVSVLGNQGDISKIVAQHKADEIIIAIPSATASQIKAIVNNCRKTGLRVKTTPPASSLINGTVHLHELRDIVIEDLLGRKPIKLDYSGIEKEIQQHTVLITGAGGSIGSELAWQIARYKPRQLILYERGESELYDIELRIKQMLPKGAIIPVIGDILDTHRLNEIMERYQPDLFYHAAAYKHVPMLELNPSEAVENNLLGTRNVAAAAIRHRVKKFIFISTDKAVRPTSIMGATKRAAELMLQTMPDFPTKFITVRFGNVLGSRGSVVPLFKKQIAEGGPVTVTHPYITRYFMAISEAAQLVLHAGIMGEGGEIFLLDMGEPVKISELAENLIRLSGLEPYKDIEIVFTGLRPGEKLYEELFNYWEELLPTSHNKIMKLNGTNPDPGLIISAINDLEKLVMTHDKKGVIAKLKEIVPSYKESYCHKLDSLEGVIEKDLELDIKFCGREFKAKVLDWEKEKSILMAVNSPFNLNMESQLKNKLSVTFCNLIRRKVFRFDTLILNSQNGSGPPLLKVAYPSLVEERDDLRGYCDARL
jgi:FlaA1/EpsC-like NDP-sugar epimerase